MSRTLRITALTVAAVLGAIQAFAHRHAMNPDGLSYLDLARAFLSGHLDTAINPHWGPLYPALLAVAFLLGRASIETMIPIVHAVGFVTYLLALAAFDFFLRELLRDRDETTGPAVFGYAVFIYTALWLTGLDTVSPDLCLAASVFAAAGLILRARRLGPTVSIAALLGVVLALGYFAKSVMFVLGLIFIGALLFLPNGRRRPWRAIGVATVVFVALSSLLIVPFSRETGGFTFGTSGKLAYNWEVNRIPYTNWQGDARTPLQHPPRQIHADPDVFEYTQHLEGTYPPWFDPAYWNAGATTSIRPFNQLLQLHRSLKFYVELFMGGIGATATLLVLLAWGSHIRSYMAVLLPSLAALALYSPVHLEPRYVTPFVALLWVVPVAAFHPASPGVERWRFLNRAMMVASLLLVVPVAFRVLSDVWGRRDEPYPHPAVATALHRLGIAPGERVANATRVRGENFGSSFEGYWAYLAGVHIVAEISEQRDFLCRDAATTETVLAELAAVGARAVVTRAIPLAACTAGWQPIDGTDFYVRLLSPHPK